MIHFGLVCPPFPSHVRVFEALAAALAERGHRATFVLNAGAGELVREGPWGVREVGLGLPARGAGDRSTGLLGVLRTVADAARRTEGLAGGGAAALRAAGVDAILADQMEPAGGLLAARLGLPFVSVASALPIDPHPAMPPPYLDWPYDPTPEGLKRNRGGRRVASLLLRRQGEAIRRSALALGLEPFGRMEDWLSPIGTVSQTLPAFDFPYAGHRRVLGVGPCRAAGEGEGALPFRRDPVRPLVFASLGTLQGHRAGLFRAIAKACATRGFQLALAHCGRLSSAQAATIDAEIVTDFLPQRAVLRAADICITHGGLNTVLDAMEFGVPTLAIPIAYDQPGVAARLVHHGAGLKLSRRRAGAEAIGAALDRLLAEPAFGREARIVGEAIGQAGGAPAAAGAIEAWIGEAMGTSALSKAVAA
ncbi:glycosyltransferase [Aureimonas sp. ME7]|uniref:nucleotide disphospho-sugar-binding domain-containing protein n=1 Tax=Aureimonas sp. ME7 TaxID=2744252 RepID=UPI0015F65FDB|nr:glycosyltransferase [Aureimonas sp. ME7]